MTNRRLFEWSTILEWSAILATTLVAALLRFYQLGSVSLWDGEIFTLLFTQYDWGILIPSVSVFSAHPPLWFVLTKLIAAAGWNEALLRAPAAFAGIAAVPALYVLGKRLLNARVGLFGAALLALSPMHVLFSQNARNYAFFVLLVILIVYAAYRATQTPRTAARWWVLFAVCALAGLYTHYLFILPLFGTILAVILKLVRDAMGSWQHWKEIRRWSGLALVSGRGFLIALIAVSALYLPWTPTVGSAFLGRQLSREQGHEEDENAALTIQDAPRLLKDFSGEASWGLVLFSALAVVGIVYAWQDKKRDALFWFGTSIALPLLFMLLLAPRRLPAKYLIYVLPAYLLFVANGVMAITTLLQTRVLNTAPRAAGFGLAMLGVLAVATVPNMPYWNGKQAIFTGKGWQVVDEWKPWREVAAGVTSRAQPGDMILFPDEARALTARSVVPYFDTAFLQHIYNAPPQGRVWWVSERQDISTAPVTTPETQTDFGPIVVQSWQVAHPFREITLSNPSFEDGFKTWDKSNDLADWASDETQAADGKTSARVTLKKGQNTSLRSADVPVTAGKMYRVTAYIKNPTLGFYTSSPQLYVQFYAPSDTTPQRTKLATLAPSDKPGWLLMVSDGIVPADAATARIQLLFRDYSKTLGQSGWVDDIRMWLEE